MNKPVFKNWVITIPKSVNWDTYLAELDSAWKNGHVLNYKVRHFPDGMNYGDKIFILNDGLIRGYTTLINMQNKAFTCTTTGTQYPKANYLVRSAHFIPIIPVKATGFRGIRALEKVYDGTINVIYN